MSNPESVIHRIEAAIAKLSGGGGGGDENAVLASWDEFVKASVKPFVDTCGHIAGLGPMAEATTAAFAGDRNVLDAAAHCKKPSDEALGKFIEPIASVITKAGETIDKKSPLFNHQSAFSEVVQTAGWVLQPGPKSFVTGQLEAADFYLTKILTAAKAMIGDEQKHHREFVSNMKKLVNDLTAYTGDHFKTGITWNAKGSDISAFKLGAGHAAAPAATHENFGTVTPALMHRLLALAAKLESVKLSGKGGGDEKEASRTVAAWEDYFKTDVVPLIEVAKQIKGAEKIADMADHGFKVIGKIIADASTHKKPSDEMLGNLLGPVGKIIGDADAYADKRSPVFNFQKAWAEVVQALSWVVTPGPKAHITGALEAADFYLSKILVEAKKLEGADQQHYRDFVSRLKKAFNGMADYTNEYFKQGLEWNPKGAALTH